jgi:hypothetical protein
MYSELAKQKSIIRFANKLTTRRKTICEKRRRRRSARLKSSSGEIARGLNQYLEERAPPEIMHTACVSDIG